MPTTATRRNPTGPPGRPPTLPTELMHQLVRNGLSNKEISAELVREGYAPATSAAVTAWKKRHDYPVKSSTAARLELIPWKVAVEHSHNRLYICLALEARALSGGDLSPKDHTRLDKFKRELAEQRGVVHYSRANGFMVLTRREGIDLSWIREPRLDNEGRPIEFDPAQ